MSFIFQNILPYPRHTGQIRVRQFTSRSADSFLPALRQLNAAHVGISLQLCADGRVAAIAFATKSEAFYFTLEAHLPTTGRAGTKGANTGPKSSKKVGILDITTEIVSQLGKVLVGFSMARLALHLVRELSWHVNGVDLSSLLISSHEKLLSPSDFLYKKVYEGVDKRQVDSLWYPDTDDDTAMSRVCQRAWISAICADADLVAMASAKHVNTRYLQPEQLACLTRNALCADLLDAQKPTVLENEFSAVESAGDGLMLENARYKTRVRASNQTSVVFESDDGRRIVGQAVSSEGKRTKIHLMQGQYHGSGIARVVVHGREELTFAENARDDFVLRLMQGTISLRDRVLIDLVWFPSPKSLPASRPPYSSPPRTNEFSKLNGSQQEVAAAMVSPVQSIVIAHGPPGTGKTTTIAAAVDYWISLREPAWIVAQSNVGVKNIARSLAGKGITDFKIIVSKEFYVEWHEDLYTEIQDNLIRSDDLSKLKDPYEVERLLLGSRIVLCTLSTLSNPVLDNCWMFGLVPTKNLVVDEASQINVFDFMHLFHKFKILEKVCFFGDPKQLPPFGKESVPQLQSIFDIKHLKPTAYFLDTQYRMPVPLGEFISHTMYNSKLKSRHKIQSASCVAFVDVSRGKEERAGKSWMNTSEVEVVVRLVRDYCKLDYCVITPYDAQRGAIVKALKAASLPDDRVFNVDSFQGHEADYIIVSPTRTASPGFLSVQSRTNVMLTRCRAGMIIVSNEFFASSVAKRTLLGELAAHWDDLSPDNSTWISMSRLLNRAADLPGIPGRVSRLPISPSLHVAPPPNVVTNALSTSRSSPQQSFTSISSASTATRVNSLAAPTRRVTQPIAYPSTRVQASTSSRRVDDPDFPELPNSDFLRQPILQGQWRRVWKPARQL